MKLYKYVSESRYEEVQAIPLAKVEQAKEEIKNLKEYGAKFDDGFEIHVNKADVLEIIGNLIAESEG